MPGKQERKNQIIVGIMALFVASITYCPHHVKYSTGGGSSSYGYGVSSTYSTTEIDRVQYAWIWDAPESSSLEFGRLAVTWMAIAVVGAGALYLNRNSED
jgi:hypothetical protein